MFVWSLTDSDVEMSDKTADSEEGREGGKRETVSFVSRSTPIRVCENIVILVYIKTLLYGVWEKEGKKREKRRREREREGGGGRWVGNERER